MFERSDFDPNDAQMHAWVDGRMSPEDSLAFEAHLKTSEILWAQAQAWRRQRHQLQELHRHVLSERPPASLHHWYRTSAKVHRHQRWQWVKLGGVASSLVLSMGIGWSMGQLAQDPPMANFAKQATVAHVVYQPEQRHPVEVGADQQEHLVKWLSNRLGQRVVVANLESAGFDLMGGRLLPGDGGPPRAQFMYQNRQGDRITLYMGVLPEARTKTEKITLFNHGSVPALYWSANGNAYTLSGHIPESELERLAQHTHSQLTKMNPI